MLSFSPPRPACSRSEQPQLPPPRRPAGGRPGPSFQRRPRPGAALRLGAFLRPRPLPGAGRRPGQARLRPARPLRGGGGVLQAGGGVGDRLAVGPLAVHPETERAVRVLAALAAFQHHGTGTSGTFLPSSYHVWTVPVLPPHRFAFIMTRDLSSIYSSRRCSC